MLKRILIAALWLPLIAFGQSYPSPTFNNLTVNGTFTATGKVGLGSLAAQAANTVVGNATNASASPTAIAVTGCNGAAQALQWTNGSGFGCNSNIATSGANANITSLSGLSTPLSVSQGGTGGATLAQYQPLAGSGTGAITTLGTGTAGQVLTSNGNAAYPSFQTLSGRLIGVQTFCPSGCTSTGGTYTPDSGTNSVIVEVQAAGGGSGGSAATSSSQISASAGSGSGAYAKVRFTSGFSGVTVTIGTAGAAGSAGGSGGNASATTFGALISCPGGNGSSAGGTISNTGNGGVTAGASGTSAPTISGGTTLVSVPGRGTVASLAISAQAFLLGGANSVLGSGGILTTSSISTSGASGVGYGSGASGSYNNTSQSAIVGMAGQPAIVIVYEYN